MLFSISSINFKIAKFSQSSFCEGLCISSNVYSPNIQRALAKWFVKFNGITSH